MTAVLSPEGTIHLTDLCGIDDAETLLRLHLDNRAAVVDLRNCEHAHSAVLQVLLAIRPKLLLPTKESPFRAIIGPMVNGEMAHLVPAGRI